MTIKTLESIEVILGKKNTHRVNYFHNKYIGAAEESLEMNGIHFIIFI